MFPLLILLFIALPIAELYVIVQVGQAIGLLPTLALLIVDSLVGAALARSQSRAAWERFNRALAEGRVPGRETFDGAMVILGGALLITPGFITDAFGLALLLPPTRALIRNLLVRALGRRGRLAWRVSTFGGAGGDAGRGPADDFERGPSPFPPANGRPPRDYDYEGTAREIRDPPGELGDGEDD